MQIRVIYLLIPIGKSSIISENVSENLSGNNKMFYNMF
jgi:hypothetical protein